MRSVGDIDDLVTAYPGPAFCCSKDGQNILCNSAAKNLGDEAALAAPALAAMRGHEDASATTWRTPVGKGDDRRTLEWTAFLVPPDAILVLGRDVTMESELSQGLAESRQRYRDIVELSRDFIWETDADGRFTFVSPRGGFGYTDTELSGQSSSLLLAGDSASESPFTHPQPINGRETWLMRKDGGLSLAAIFAHPLTMEGRNRIAGFRGICRPIGETVNGGEQSPESLFRIAEYVTRPLGSGQDIRAAATLVAGAAARALAAIGVAIGVKDAPAHAPRLAAFSSPPSPKIVEQLLRCIGNGENPSLAGGLLFAPAWQGGETVGGIAAWRDTTPFRPGEERLFAAIVERLGPAIAATMQTGEMERTSRTDALTGLANRQGFEREAAHRLESGSAFALIFIGISGSGPVTDDILRSLAAILTGAIRRNDFAARIGNSEFAILVEGGEEAALSNIRKRITDSARNLRPPPGISIGEAIRREGETLESLIRRADDDRNIPEKR